MTTNRKTSSQAKRIGHDDGAEAAKEMGRDSLQHTLSSVCERPSDNLVGALGLAATERLFGVGHGGLAWLRRLAAYDEGYLSAVRDELSGYATGKRSQQEREDEALNQRADAE